MSNPVPSEPSQISLKMTVRNQAQARELDMAWREIISGERLARTEVLENDTQSIMDRAQEALQIIETAIGNNPTSGQAGRLVRFLAGVYNGSDYPFDLTDLRVLDTRLANACLDYLNYDRYVPSKKMCPTFVTAAGDGRPVCAIATPMRRLLVSSFIGEFFGHAASA